MEGLEAPLEEAAGSGDAKVDGVYMPWRDKRMRVYNRCHECHKPKHIRSISCKRGKAPKGKSA